MSDFLSSISDLESHSWYNLGENTAAFESAMENLAHTRIAARIWARDGLVWSQDPVVATEAASMLGWLDLPAEMSLEALRLKALAVEVRAAQMERVILLGMGGSSLAPEVLRHVLGVAPDRLDLSVLDTTDPAQILRVAQEGDLARTLFLVSSKSGTTAETLSLYEYFRGELSNLLGRGHWSEHFVAITDPDTSLEKLATGEGFRALYSAPPAVGGRYSALSVFGLVPAALIGVDIEALAGPARQMAWQCRGTAPVSDNPGLVLGAIMGTLATDAVHPRDKLTLITSAELYSLGAWIEQLVAESTGKIGVGIVPVEGEPRYEPEQYGADRLFAYIRLDGADNAATDTWVGELVEAGHPVVVLPVRSTYDLGGEFFRWEFATAVAGHLLGVNPFDQPDVESAKNRARKALARYEESRALPEEAPVLTEGDISVWGPAHDIDSLHDYLREFVQGIQEGDYLALMAYIDRHPAHDEALQAIRRAVGQARRMAVTLGYGPRFLHSTGQLHKGGRNNGLYVQITQDDAEDVSIPGRSYTFGILKQAQALGDMEALRDAGRRVIRLNVGRDPAAGLRRLAQAFQTIMEQG